MCVCVGGYGDIRRKKCLYFFGACAYTTAFVCDYFTVSTNCNLNSTISLQSFKFESAKCILLKETLELLSKP